MLWEVAAMVCPTQASQEAGGMLGPRGRAGQLWKAGEPHCPTKENQKYPAFVCFAGNFYRVMLQLK